MAPPPFGGVEFPSSTTHYLTSGQAAIDSGDVEDMAAALRAKGYGLAPGSQLLLLCNATESKAVQSWRRGVVTANGVSASHDFIPSASAKVPPFLTDQSVEGTRAAATFGGHDLLGSYGYVWLVESAYIPAGYIAVVCSHGPNSPQNVIGFRQHPDTALQGLKIIPGSDWSPYPISGSYFTRTAGVGVRQRGGGFCMQISANASYTPPTALIPV